MIAAYGDSVHQPVMLREVMQYLVPSKNDALMVDATLGLAGHSSAFLSKYSSLRIIGVDADSGSMDIAKSRLVAYAPRVEFVHSFFDVFFESYLQKYERPNLILFDFGVSMFHFKESGRGFSLKNDEPLDMRLDINSELTASDIVNEYDERALLKIISTYGEESFAMPITRAIIKARSKAPIQSTQHLASIIKLAVPPNRRYGRIHPATRSFQALRIAVNDELGRIERGLKHAINCLADGGLLACISFHSLEDRIVKQTIRNYSTKLETKPINKVGLVAITKKPLEPSNEELVANPASRSAKLRVARACITDDLGAL